MGCWRNTDNNSYAQAYPGFESLFGVDLLSADKQAHVVWPEELYDLGQGGWSASGYVPRSITHLGALRRRAPSLTWRWCTFPIVYDTSSNQRLKSHDELKALGARLGIPTPSHQRQIAEVRQLGRTHARSSVALYAPLAGRPGSWRRSRAFPRTPPTSGWHWRPMPSTDPRTKPTM